MTYHHAGPVTQAKYSPDGRLVLTTSRDGTAQVWDAASGTPVSPPLHHARGVLAGAFNRRGNRVATAGVDGTAQIWNTRTGAPVGPPLSHDSVVLACLFSPSDDLLITGAKDGTVTAWDTQSFAPRYVIQLGKPLESITLSSDGKWLATGTTKGVARLWDANNGKAACDPLLHDQGVTGCVFSPDNQLLITTSLDQTASLWDVPTGQRVGTVLQHAAAVRSAAFAENDRLFVTADLAGVTRLWDLDSLPQPAWKFVYREAFLRAAQFALNDQLIVTAAAPRSASSDLRWGNGYCQLWDVSARKPLAPPLLHQGPITSLAVSPDETSLLTASDDGTARKVALQSTNLPLRDLSQVVQLLTGSRYGHDMQFTKLDIDVLQRQFQAMRAKYPRYFEPSNAQIEAWNRFLSEVN